MKRILQLFSLLLSLISFPQARQITISADLTKCPETNASFLNDEYKEITLPDLHGNALKLLNALIATNVVQLDAKNYASFLTIYSKEVDSIKANDLINFKKNLDSISLMSNKDVFIRLIGDEFADRGSNDFWTLYLLAHLQKLGLKMEFILSNHGFDFLLGVETRTFYPQTLLPAYASSLINLKTLIKKGLVDKEDIKILVDPYYRRSLKLLSYTVSEKEDLLSVYTHAPAGLEEFKELAHYFGLEYKDASAKDLATTIDQINNAFTNQVTEFGVRSIYSKTPFKFLWNRDYEDLNRPSEYRGYALEFVHGHDSGESTKGNIFNLDHENALGKMSWITKGSHQIFVKD